MFAPFGPVLDHIRWFGRQSLAMFGFTRPYSFALWAFFTFIMASFCIIRLQTLSALSAFCTTDEGGMAKECYYYLKPGTNRVGIVLHLVCALPGALLACLQFIPIIRQRLLVLHRVNGHFVILLTVLGTIGGLLVGKNSFIEGFEWQAVLAVVGLCFFGSAVIAFISIKRLQIEKHRAWMLRAWFYVSKAVEVNKASTVFTNFWSLGIIGWWTYHNAFNRYYSRQNRLKLRRIIYRYAL